jgi:hypothetical protein
LVVSPLRASMRNVARGIGKLRSTVGS